jgi:hypothetical protein
LIPVRKVVIHINHQQTFILFFSFALSETNDTAMKKYIYLLFVLMISASPELFAQKESEFTISLSASEIEVKAGDSREITINLTRSRGYNKAKAKLGVSSTLPKGITITYEPQDGLIHASIAKITVEAGTPPGTYMLVPNCTMNYKSKGTMLKLTVLETSAEAVTKSNGEIN